MPPHKLAIPAALLFTLAGPATAQDMPKMPNTSTRPTHLESERSSTPTTHPVMPPSLPVGMTLEEVLDRAAKPPPADFPQTIHDDPARAFLLFEQLEYGFGADNSPDSLGWRAKGWLGYNYNKLWLRTEGNAVFDGPDHGESETDLLYSRLISPFWYAQAGVQYANNWDQRDYDDRWSGVLAVTGLAPGMFDVESSLYISQDADVTLRLEASYDLRLTQRLVLQPRTEWRLAAQDVDDRTLGAGITSADAELRLRYEFSREFAPYIGLAYHRLLGETSSRAQSHGDDSEQILLLLGLRLAF